MQNRLYIGNFVKNVAARKFQELFEPSGFAMEVKLARGGETDPAPETRATDESAGAALNALNGASLPRALFSAEVARIQALATHGCPGGDA